MCYIVTEDKSKKIREDIISAGYIAVRQLIKIAKEEVIKPDPEDELAADRLKNAAATKKLALLDAFEILSRIEGEKDSMGETDTSLNTTRGFAERRSK